MHMTTMRVFLILMFVSSFTVQLQAQTLNASWKQDLERALSEFVNCKESGNSECGSLTGESLKKVYNINDFYSSSKKRYMGASEISSFVKDNRNWTALGPSFDQSVLEAAQQNANNKKAVVAVYQDEDGLGHVVLIVPGTLTPSGSWGLKVPNAVSFFANDPQRSFVDKGLSFAFTKSMMKDVVLYVRKY
jgi:hypothetical protein